MKSVEGMEFIEDSTYVVNIPGEKPVYVTINDEVIDVGTENECRKPFEIFINLGTTHNFEWVVALTRVISALLRQGGDVSFVARELQEVFDPKGGYYKPGGKFKKSLVSEIGDVIERHFKKIGLVEQDLLTEEEKKSSETDCSE